MQETKKQVAEPPFPPFALPPFELPKIANPPFALPPAPPFPPIALPANAVFDGTITDTMLNAKTATTNVADNTFTELFMCVLYWKYLYINICITL